MAIQVLDRAVKLLRLVARRGPSTLTELSQEAELPLPTAARILASLEHNGLLGRVDGKRYQLGARLLPLIVGLEPFRKSLASIHPTLEDVARLTGEDSGFAVLQGNEAIVVDWCYGMKRPRVIEPYAREIPLYCAFGKVLIAYQPAAWRQRFLRSAKLRKMAAGTVASKEELVAEIVRIRQSGYHLSLAENVEGAGSLSVPVFDAMSRLQGALFITGPLDPEPGRFAKHRKLLTETASRLQREFRKSARPSRG